MRYSYEFKMYCIELYQQGKWPDTPEGIKTKNFRIMISRWKRKVDSSGPLVLLHSKSKKKWTAKEKYELVKSVLDGRSCQSVALENGINTGQFYTWVRKYRELGYDGLETHKLGRPPKDPTKMKKKPNDNSQELTESEREELLRLRKENARIKAEIEVIKKEIALREEKQAALLKAKKQSSSKNSAKKDTN